MRPSVKFSSNRNGPRSEIDNEDPLAFVWAIVWFCPLPERAHTEFSLHTLLHLRIEVIAAPLLAFGLAARLPLLPGIGNALSWGLLASLFEMIAVWGWHIPILQNATGANTGRFALEQLSFQLGKLAMYDASFAATDRLNPAAAAIELFDFHSYDHVRHVADFGAKATVGSLYLQGSIWTP